jgi:hypothetical protein
VIAKTRLPSSTTTTSSSSFSKSVKLEALLSHPLQLFFPTSSAQQPPRHPLLQSPASTNEAANSPTSSALHSPRSDNEHLAVIAPLLQQIAFQVCALKAMTQSLTHQSAQSFFVDSDSKSLLSGISTRLNEIDLKLSFVIGKHNSLTINDYLSFQNFSTVALHPISRQQWTLRR